MSAPLGPHARVNGHPGALCRLAELESLRKCLPKGRYCTETLRGE